MRPVLLNLALVIVIASPLPVAAQPDSGNENAPSWPAVLVVGADQAIVCNNHLFLEGDSLRFSFRADTLWCNDLVWRPYTYPEKKPATSNPGLWVEKLRGRYQADTTGTSEERIERALAGMEEGVLDPEAPITISEGRLDARFLDGEELIMYFEDPEPRIVPEESAAQSVASLRKSLARGHPYILVNYPKRGYQLGDVRIVRAFERARRGKLSAADRALARGNGILEAMEAIAERANMSGGDSDQ